MDNHRRNRRRIGVTVAAMTALLSVAQGSARAHSFEFTDVQAVLTTDGEYRIDMTVDVDALALGVSPAVDSKEIAAALRAMSPADFEAAVEKAKHTMLRRVRVQFDGEKQTPDVSFPQRHAPATTTQTTEPTVLGLIARLEGDIPDGAQQFTFGASRAFQIVHLTIDDEIAGTESKQIIIVGADSLPYDIGRPQPKQSTLAVAERYLILGYEHILPKGLDHILFVLGLFLLSTKLGPLLWQITAFTVAHSVTLALSIYGVVSLPPQIVEPLIALSIAYVAIENLLTRELKPWRVAVVFTFGLLHGLGFAGVLQELGLPHDQFATALITFNVGVELGQLSVVLLAFLLVGWFRNKPWYRNAIVIPASACIALVGLYWAVERTFIGV